MNGAMTHIDKSNVEKVQKPQTSNLARNNTVVNNAQQEKTPTVNQKDQIDANKKPGNKK